MRLIPTLDPGAAGGTFSTLARLRLALVNSGFLNLGSRSLEYPPTIERIQLTTRYLDTPTRLAVMLAGNVLRPTEIIATVNYFSRKASAPSEKQLNLVLSYLVKRFGLSDQSISLYAQKSAW
jgi:hypothetical protein